MSLRALIIVGWGKGMSVMGLSGDFGNEYVWLL